MLEWKEKPMIFDNKRHADKEAIDLNIHPEDIIEILEDGSEVKKRKKGIVERWLHKGRYIYIAVAEDYGDYWLIRHLGKIKATKKNLKRII